MLKTAYQIGLAQAFEDIDVSALIKEAQELGIPAEKTALLGSGLGKMLSSGIGSLGKGIGKALPWAAKNPALASAGVGSAVGALGAGMSGGDVGVGAIRGGLLGSFAPGMARGAGKFMMSGPAGSARAKFMKGIAQGAL